MSLFPLDNLQLLLVLHAISNSFTLPAAPVFPFYFSSHESFFISLLYRCWPSTSREAPTDFVKLPSLPSHVSSSEEGSNAFFGWSLAFCVFFLNASDIRHLGSIITTQFWFTFSMKARSRVAVDISPLRSRPHILISVQFYFNWIRRALTLCLFLRRCLVNFSPPAPN